MNKPLIRGRKIIQQLSKDRSPSVLRTDEKIFTVQFTHNSQNDRILTWKKEDIPMELRTALRR
ncbi:Transposable element Tc3 transposase [Caligus rogercresseyi]|uniref:Transposable element Tc3 transposase n=1 Tax=Caligus rogercresseyi TaxID=217165 RepID=A0A7T8KCD4_CALRO|nr:Transposable element Tc3 transposase [Caligus rogercresseyi]